MVRDAERAARIAAGLGGKEQKELADLPARIAALEKEIATIEAVLHDPDFYARDAAKFQKASELLCCCRVPQMN